MVNKPVRAPEALAGTGASGASVGVRGMIEARTVRPIPPMDHLFFVASKVLRFALVPLYPIFTLGLVATVLLLAGRTRAARNTLLVMTAGWLLLGYHPLPVALLRMLEDAVPRTSVEAQALTGIVVLGGAVGTGRLPKERNEASLDAAAERMTVAVELARRNPHLLIVFSGFSGELFPEGWNEAEVARKFFEDQGIEASRLIFEAQSRNTYENARLSAPIVRSHPGRWGLVTSASHMLRADLAFRRFVPDLVPIPVDYRTGRHVDPVGFDLNHGNRLWGVLLHEVVGLAVYRLSGKL
jgi:uncharacterized SAM-binding protein YcdF (DUF218 family)